jgi:hypothetical protein
MPPEPDDGPVDAEPIEIHAVLDASALLSYARGHVHVGELLIDIADADGYLGLPTLALLAAHVQLLGNEQARARFGVLATLPGVAILELSVEQSAEVARHVPLAAGDLVRAQVTWAVLKHGAYYLTCEPDAVPMEVPHDQVHVIPTDDA